MNQSHPGAARERLTAEHLRELASTTLDVPLARIALDRPLVAQGFDSLSAARLAERITERWRVACSIEDVLSAEDLAELAEGLALAPAASDGEVKSQLSAMQRAFLHAQELAPESGEYTLALPLRMPGLQRAALRRAVAQLWAERRDLRSTFVRGRDGELELGELDASLVVLREHEALPDLRALARQPFVLAEGPLFTVDVWQESVLLRAHHAIVDLHAAERVVARFFALYRAFAEGRTPTPISWSAESERVASPESIAFWSQQLEDLTRGFRLPWAEGSGLREGTRIVRPLSSSLVAQLRALAAARGLTLFSLLLTAYRVAYARYAGSAELTVGTPVTLRRRADSVGCLLNTCPLRAQLRPESSLLAHARREHAALLDVLMHRDAPFSQLVELINPARSAGETPWLDTMFALQRADHTPGLTALWVGRGGARAIEGVDVEPLQDVLAPDVRFDLTLRVIESDEELDCVWELPAADAQKSAVHALVASYERILHQLCEQPDLPLAELEFATSYRAPEQGPIDDAWRCDLYAQFAEQVRRAPDAIAVRSDTQSITYLQLDRMARSAAALLARSGLAQEEPVAILLGPGAEQVAALLGTLRAGGACLAVDPTQPRARLRATLAGCRKGFVEHALEELPGAITLEALRAGFRSALESPYVPCAAEQLAYIAFTSGSTGVPKGVMISQRAAANFGVAQRSALGIERSWSALQLCSLGFDASLSDLLMTLLAGGTLCVVPPALRFPGPELAQFIARLRPTLITATTSTLEALPERALASARAVISVGEPCSARLLAQVGPGATLYNGYGPTETTIGATLHAVTPADVAAVRIPIGRPFANYTVHVVDALGAQASDDARGELYVGGVGLARGYAGQPARTAEAFVPDPWAARPGARMYRTGDRGRRCADGLLDCFGRVDQQLKLRGFRIEPGEVVSALSRHAAVRECLVDALELDGRTQLVAFVVLREHVPDFALASFLRELLPSYMVPARFVRVAELPRTGAGKLDSRALATLASQRPAVEQRADDALQRSVQSAFEDVLGHAVRLDDNFFDVGGHSLLLAKLKSELERRTGATLSLLALFSASSVQRVTQLLRGNTNMHDGLPADPRRDDAQLERRIAVIGMAIDVAGARDLEAFWQMLTRGECAVRRFSKAELAEAGVEPALYEDPAYVPARAAVTEVEGFDAELFELSDREAELLDPQQRLLLECAQRAFDDAGYAPRRPRELGETGVFVAVSKSSYYDAAIAPRRALTQMLGPIKSAAGSDRSFSATSIGYKFNLSGPCVTVDTACSSSLVALHQAVHAILQGDCELALTGAASVDVPLAGGHLFEHGGIASPDGLCRPFDAAAEGTVKGMGAGVVLLKRLDLALRDGDPIHAVICGSAVNNDGATKLGFSAPSVDGQARVIARALQRAGLSPAEIDYVESHGTGTALGDPVELEALNRVFAGLPARSIGLGAVKGNVGHLDAAAGIVGFIKAALVVARGQLPPIAHLREPSPRVPWNGGPFYPVAELRPIARERPLRAGVSAFGIGGSNAHVVLEAAPSRGVQPALDRAELILLSAQSAASLQALAGALSAKLEEPGLRLADVAFTLAAGRAQYSHRCALVVDSSADLRRQLSTLQIATARPSPRLALVCGVPAKVGSLYEREPIFRDAFERCLDAIPQLAGELRAWCTGADVSALAERVARFAAGYAAHALLAAWNVHFSAFAGDTALVACLAGTRSLDEALQQVAADVRNDDSLPELLRDEELLLVTLGSAAEVLDHDGYRQQKIVSLLADARKDARAQLLRALARLFELGVPLPRSRRNTGERAVSLPGYRFDRKRYWLEPVVGTRDVEPKVESSDDAVEVVASCFAELLGRPRVARDDDFHALGGDSLLATRLRARLRERLGWELSVSELMNAATPARIAECARPMQRERAFEHDQVLSDAQLGVWLAHQSAGAALNLPTALRIEGPLELDTLRAALELVLRRHAILSHRVEGEHGLPRLVRAPEPPTLNVRMVAAWEPALDQLAERPFDLARDALLRAELLVLSPTSHVLVLVAHHIIADGWSLQILWRETVATYRALAQAQRPALPAAASFLEYASKPSSEERVAAAQRYFRERLERVPATVLLPDVDRPNAGARVLKRTLSGTLSARIRDACQTLRVTRYSYLLSAFQLLLARYSGRSSSAVVTPFGGRPDSRAEQVVGMFVQLVPVCSEFANGQSFAETVCRVQRELSAAFDHAQALQGRASEQGSRLNVALPIAFALRNEFPASVELAPGIEASPVLIERRHTRFDLTLWVDDREQLELALEYRAERYGEAALTSLLASYEQILDQLAARPELPLGALRIRAEQGAITAAAPEPLERVERQFERRARETPDAIAIVAGDQRVTYAALNARANGIARALRARGAQPGQNVGVCCERSVDLVTALLATLKAGCAFVPLDPELPPRRVRDMIEDADVRLVLGQPIVGVETVPLQATSSAQDLRLSLPADGTAYVLFTSGSTGRPKGAAIGQRALINRLQWQNRNYGIDAHARVLHKTPIGFDVSLWEVFCPLIAGAQLVLAEPGKQRDPQYLARLTSERAVSHVHYVPSLLALYLEQAGALGSRALRWIICSGEGLPASLQAAFERRFAGTPTRLANLYGPTEAAIDVSAWNCDVPSPTAIVPIGYPIDNVQLYVLDPALERVPTGAVGELYIGGVALATGYVNRPALSAERFCADPYAEQAGARMYRTGDRARQREDGSIEYLGRDDQQVKLRGQRIELGEIENALLATGLLREAAVSLHGEGEAAGLIANVVPQSERAPVVTRLAQRAQELADASWLPNGMPAFALNRSELEFSYRELFEDAQYTRFDLNLPREAVVLDVGANVGLFALQVATLAPDAHLLAYEPAPAVHAVLTKNLALYLDRALAIPLALSDRAGRAAFTFYANDSVISGLHADRGQDARVVESYLRTLGTDAAEQELNALSEYATRGETLMVDTTTLSDEIDRHGLTTIDLLKIDAELAELAILRGVRAEHWPRIRQVVAEVHDKDGALAAVRSLLCAQGFSVRIEAHPQLPELYGVHARRELGSRVDAWPASASSPSAFRSAVREALTESLPAALIPARIQILAGLPKTYSGKLDRKLLPSSDPLAPTQTAQQTLRGGTEHVLAKIWSDLLGGQSVDDANANFFALGGNSLSAVRMVQRVERKLGKAITLDDVQGHACLRALARALDDRDETASDQPRIVSDSHARYEPFPLTEVQQAYWLGRSDDFDLGQVSTHGYLEIDCDSVDHPRLTRAVNAMIARHDMLRAVVTEDGRQRVLRDVPRYEPIYMDLSRGDLDRQLAEIRAAMSHHVFDLTRFPCFEIRVSRLAQKKYRVHLSIDALAVDGMSALLLVRDLNALYGDLARPLPTLSSSFRDYACARLAWKEGPAYRKAQTYWLERMASLPEPPALPRRARGQDAPRFTRRHELLSRPALQQLREHASARGLTLSSVVLTAYGEVLATFANSKHFLLNLPISDRPQEELAQVVGNFTRTLLFEFDARAADDFAAAVQGVQKQLLRDLAHGAFDGIELVRARARERGTLDRASSPIVFTSMLAHDVEEGTSFDGPFDLRRDAFGITQTPQVLLDCTAIVRDGELAISWDAVDDAFQEGALDAMFNALMRRLRALAGAGAWRAPFRAACELSNASLTPAPQRHDCNTTLHQLFLCAAEKYGSKVAVRAGEVQLSYRELELRARALASALSASGQAPGDQVAVFMEKGWQQVVATLGIMLAGGVYMPLDARLAVDRRETCLALGQVRFVVTQPHLQAELERSDLQTFVIDADYEPRFTELPDVRPDALAYVIFTSGSTGTPKGVLIEHRGAVNTVLDINHRFGVGPSDAVLAVSSLSFDLSVYDLFGVLAAGGTVVFPDPMAPLDPAGWVEVMREGGVTLWNTVPMLMQHLIEYLELSDAPHRLSLRQCLLSGDWVPLDLFERIRVQFPDAAVSSLGGATEASIWSIEYPIERIDPSWRSVPYGKALSGQSVFVLDDALEACPTWVTGELHIGGIGLARGYLGDEALTAQRFVSHPRLGVRLYRTGDLGRLLPDGNIEFLGRMDSQIKIQGHRLELTEIESVLAQHPVIQRAVVAAEREGREVKRLNAYVTLNTKLASDADPTGVGVVQRLSPALFEQRWANVRSAPPCAAPADESAEALRLRDRLTAQYTNALCALFARCGHFERVGDKTTLDALLFEQKFAARYRRWLMRALSFLVQRGVLVQRGPLYEVVRPISSLLDPEAGVPDVPLWELLTESTHSAETYADESTAGKYQEYFAEANRSIAELFARLLPALPARPRILEVGAGYGSTTRHLLPLLPEGTEFAFTDVSTFFFDRAKQVLDARVALTFGLFDMDLHPELQGYPRHGYDIVLASSVVHNAKDLQRTLRYLRSQLAPGGLLVLLEETEFFPFFDLGMGLQQGFDGREDDALRPLHPLLSRAAWPEQLARADFVRSELLLKPGSASAVFGFDVIVAQAPEQCVSLDGAALTEFLARQLPAHAVPRNYIVLDHIPLNATGKADRRALPVAPARAREQSTFVAPETPLEVELAELWQEVLKVERVGRADHFLRVGGDSLLAAKVAMAIRSRYQIEFPIRALFETNLGELAQLVDLACEMRAPIDVGLEVGGEV